MALPRTRFLHVSHVKVGIALSPVQEGNMMDLLRRMGAVSEGGEHCQWIDASSALAAISLAGEKAGGRFFQDKVPEKIPDSGCLEYTVCFSCVPIDVSSVFVGTTTRRRRHSWIVYNLPLEGEK